MENKLIVSQSPHIHSGETVQKIMYGVLIALIPVFLSGIYFFYFRAILLTACSMLLCIGFEYLINRLILKKKLVYFNPSTLITGVLLAFIVPIDLPLWALAIGALVSIGIGKMAFGGIGKNIFNPALVGYLFLFFVFPSQMKDGVGVRADLSGTDSYSPIVWLFFGHEHLSIGGTSIFALLLGFIFLLWRKIITWHIPISIFASFFAFSAVFSLFHSTNSLSNPFNYFLLGYLVLSAVFMATDYTTSPMTKNGKIVYGIGIGLITVFLYVWGNCIEGIFFAILLMNATTPLIDKYAMPKKFG